MLMVCALRGLGFVLDTDVKGQIVGFIYCSPSTPVEMNLKGEREQLKL